jgi:hypothetical protein
MFPHYKIKDNIFKSAFAAFAYAAANDPDTRPTFDCYDEDFAKLDWSVEPVETMNELMEQRAKQLRAKYDYLALMFSGGADSLTIYDTFKRLNIHLDEIVIQYHTDADVGHPGGVIDWLKNDIYDPTTRITTLCRDEVPEDFAALPTDFITSTDFVFYSHGFKGTGVHATELEKEPRFANSNSAIIVGVDKPRVHYTNGRWLTTHLDKTFGYYQTASYEYFYITPEFPQLHMKQCHLFKNNVKRFINPTTNFDANSLHKSTFENLLLTERWMGRLNAVIHDDIRRQKISLATNNMGIASLVYTNLPGLITPSPKVILPGNPLMKKFIDGLKMFQTDNTIVNYMLRHNFLSRRTQSINDYNGIYSKFYDLGP